MSSFLWAVQTARKKRDCGWLGRLSKSRDAARPRQESRRRRWEAEYGTDDPLDGSGCSSIPPPLAPLPTPPLPPATPDPTDDVVPLGGTEPVVPLDDGGGVFFGNPNQRPEDVIPLDTSPPPPPPAVDPLPVLSNPCLLVPGGGLSSDDIARECWLATHGSARAVSECARGSGGGVSSSWCERWGHPFGPAAADAAARAQWAARPLEATPSSSTPPPYAWSSGETAAGVAAPSKGIPWWAYALAGVAVLGVIGAKGTRARGRSRRAA